MSGAAVLEVRNLSVAYGNVEALHQASLKVDTGQIVTVIGPNGAGKTTMLSAIVGLLDRSCGDIVYLGEHVYTDDVESLAARGMILVPETRELFNEMSAEDNLLLGAFPRRRLGRRRLSIELDEIYAVFPRLRERRAQPAHTLSGGERQMLALGRALMAKPKLLMLDEPSLGLAPIIVRQIFALIADLARSGVAILLIEQNARAALQISDYGYVLETGRVVLDGPSAILAKDPRVLESYLGIGAPAPHEPRSCAIMSARPNRTHHTGGQEQ